MRLNDVFVPIVCVLVLVALIVCLCVFTVYSRKSSQRRVHAALSSAAKRIFAEYGFSGGIIALQIEGEGFDSNDAYLFKQLPWLRDLRLACTGLKDEDLAALRSLPKLKVLWVDPIATISEEGIRHLSRLHSLQSLTIRTNALTSDSVLLHLSNLKDLRYLYLVGREVDSEVVDSLREKMPSCQIIFMPWGEEKRSKEAGG